MVLEVVLIYHLGWLGMALQMDYKILVEENPLYNKNKEVIFDPVIIETFVA